MKTFKSVSLVAILGLSFFFIGNSSVNAAPSVTNALVQIVPTTKRISRKAYRKGHWITVTTWRHGKRITKKVWVKGNYIGRKVGRKTKQIVMGPSRRRL